jgi:uncharacterized protein YndB with AHSA1/START domain
VAEEILLRLQRRFEAPRERVFAAWTWEGEPELMRGSEATHVAVDFLEAGDGATLVVVTHRGFAGEAIRDLHVEGWTGCLDSLERRGLRPEEGV